jgi:hypothetical protein
MPKLVIKGRFIGGPLFHPRKTEEHKAAQYGATIVLDDGEETKLAAAVTQAIADKWDGKKPPGLQDWAQRVGNDPDYPSFEKNYINPKASSVGKDGQDIPRPGTFIKRGGVVQPIDQASGIIYPGCYVAVEIDVYAYDGNGVTYISQSLRTITSEIASTVYDDIWLGWVGKRLWCSLPWLADGARTGDQQTVFVFDPQVGNGAWVVYRPAAGSLTSIVENSDIYTQYPLAVVCGHAAAACLVQLDFADTADDKLVEALTADPFDAYYTTGWQNAGWPERRKSWRRPRFILERVDETVQIDLDTYFDYNEGAPMRSHTITVNADGTAFWRATGSLEAGGFDWGDGTLWGASGAQGSVVERGVQNTATLSGLGVNKAIQLRFSTNPNYLGKAWGINAMTLKYILRRFTT